MKSGSEDPQGDHQCLLSRPEAAPGSIEIRPTMDPATAREATRD